MATSSTSKVNIKDYLQTISWNNLRSGNRATLRAFQIPLLDTAHPLECHEIVRVIPGKRLVAFGTWNAKPVVAKFFYGSHAVHKAKRESTGIEVLHKSGILAPQIYFNGQSKDKKVHIIIMERILKGLSLDDIWQAKTTLKDVSSLMQAITIEIATQHVMGLLQNDLHFKNFIIKRKQIYSIDAGALEIFDKPLSKKQSLDNLGLFFSQLGVGTTNFQKELFASYVKARSWLVKKSDLVYLENAITRWTTKRLENYTRKILRSSTATVQTKTLTRLSLYDRFYESYNFLQILKNPDAEFINHNVDILKNGGSSTVAKLKIDDKEFILKRYNIKNIFHWLRRCLRNTRALNSWLLAHRLRLLGVPTAKPIGCVEKRFLTFRNKSFLFMEYINGVDAGKFFKLNDIREELAQTVAQEIVNIIKNLAKLNMTHGDLKMTNILICNNKPILIDLDGMREHVNPRKFAKCYKQEVKRFMKNWRDQPEVYEVFERLM